MGLITSLIGMRQDRQQHADKMKLAEKGQQTQEGLALLGILEQNNQRLIQLGEQQTDLLTTISTFRRDTADALHKLSLAEDEGNPAKVARYQAMFEAANAAQQGAERRAVSLAELHDGIQQHSNRAMQFASTHAGLKDLLDMKQVVAQLQQPQQPQQPQQQYGMTSQASHGTIPAQGKVGPSPQEGAAPAPTGTAPTDTAPQAPAAGGGPRLDRVLGIAKKFSPNAKIEGEAVTITAATDKEAARIQRELERGEHAEAGIDLPINVRTEGEVTQQQGKQGADALSQVSAPLQKVGIEFGQGEDGSIQFGSAVQGPEGVTMGRPAFLAESPPEDVARAVETVAMQARQNPQIALAAQRDLGPALESYANVLANNGDLEVLQMSGQRPRYRVNLFSQNNGAARKFGEAVLALSNGGQSQNMPIFEIPTAGQAVEQFMEHARKSDEYLTEDESASTIGSILRGKGGTPVQQRGAKDAEKLVDYVAHFEEEGGQLSEEDSKAILSALKSNIGFGTYRWGPAMRDLATIAHPKYKAKILSALRIRS